jgi:hypothetical protein
VGACRNVTLDAYPLEQADILEEVTKLLVEAMPDDWRELVLPLDMLGRHNQCTTRLTRADGSRESWKVPTEALKRLASLRSGMYVDGEGTHTDAYMPDWDQVGLQQTGA